jgi:threonine dehydratase
MIGLSLESIRQAAGTIAGKVHRTPLLSSRTLSRMCGHQVYLKAENLQKTGCFKPRGALNKIARLTPEQKSCGVLAASAGNHAQGLAYAAVRLGIPVKVVMPANASPSKIEATRQMGAEVILHGDIFDDALAYSLDLQRATGMTYVHPCTDADVVSGAGTIGLEILEDLPDVDAIVAPIGGGGLIGGIAVAVKSASPAGRYVKIFGVEAAGAPAMKRSLEAGRVVVLESARSIADGMTVRTVFPETLDLAQLYLEDVLLVSDESILRGISLLLERCKLLAEGAGAGPLAALLDGSLPLPRNSKVVALISGGNQDLNILSRWLREGLPT